MLDDLSMPERGARLNRAAWHKPLISIIVTHQNYSEFVGDALASLLDQTHQNWECVVVDDASEAAHRERLEASISSISDTRISLHPLTQNVGQIHAFFAGHDRTSGDFVCLLDPDDRYAETFLEKALAAHLNETVICPIVSTDQYLMNERGIISGVLTRHKLRHLQGIGQGLRLDSAPLDLHFIPSEVRGWHWATTSSMMFRRAALNYLRPHRPLGSKTGADSYLANGAHALGGSLFLKKPLVYRSLHENNTWIRKDIYATEQRQHRDDAFPGEEAILRVDAAEVLAHNGAPRASALLMRKDPRKGLLPKLSRSILKRLPFAKKKKSARDAQFR